MLTRASVFDHGGDSGSRTALGCRVEQSNLATRTSWTRTTTATWARTVDAPNSGDSGLMDTPDWRLGPHGPVRLRRPQYSDQGPARHRL